MFEILKKIMNKKESDLNDNISVMNIKTDIKRDPNPQEDEIIFGCGCFWELKMFLETTWSNNNFCRVCWW